MDIVELFATNLQVRILKLFLEHPNKLFSCTLLAKILNSSPSAVIYRLRHLLQLGVIKVIGIDRMKLYRLDIENEVVQILLDFYRKLKATDPTSNQDRQQ